MPTVLIDGMELEVGQGRNVLQAALDHELNLPYFCWHPAMGSVGACRLCAVKQYRDAADDQGRIVMACMTPVADDTRVSIDDPDAKEFRRAVTEWLMTNHPHDCPVCDEGGECHLQDMTVMTGHAHRRFRGRKRTFRNQHLGPLIHHEMNRCITCYRCTRFYQDIAGGNDLRALASRNRVYFGRVEDGTLESPFSGNLVEVCPTGVFTDKTYRRHYTRKWDLESAPSICTQCGLGCNTLPAARYGTVRRVSSRYNGEVNGYWLCDRGRFGYEHVNADDRVLAPRQAAEVGAAQQPTDWPSLLGELVADLRNAAASGKLAGVGSPRADLEANQALRRLVGPDRFCPGTADPERALLRLWVSTLRSAAVRCPSLRELGSSDAVLVLGTDVTNEAPLVDLALLRARNQGAEIVVAALRRTRLAAFAKQSFTAEPAVLTDFGEAVADKLLAAARPGDDADNAAAGRIPERLRRLAERTAEILSAADRPSVIVGTQGRDQGTFRAGVRVARALGPRHQDGKPTWLAASVAEPNSVGVTLLDNDRGPSFEELVTAIEDGRISHLVVCENDLFRRYPDAERLRRAIGSLEGMLVIEHLPSETTRLARWVAPATTAPEAAGTLVNYEARAQRHYPVMAPRGASRPSWVTIRDVIGESLPAAEDIEGIRADPSAWIGHEDVLASLIEDDQLFAPVLDAAPPAGYRPVGQRIPRLPHRASGRTAMPDVTDIRQHRRTAVDPGSPFVSSMEGYRGHVAPALNPRFWAPGWNSNEAINRFQIEVGGPLHGGDPGRRLLDFETAASDTSASANDGYTASAEAVGTLVVCGVAEIFGSEITSRRSGSLVELVPPAYLGLHPETAAELGLEPGVRYRLAFRRTQPDAAPRESTLLVRADESLARGVATVPIGYAETRWWQQPEAVTLDTLATEEKS